VNALFKLSTGTAPEGLGFSAREYLERLAAIPSESLGTDLAPEDWHGVLPLNPARVRALVLFAESSVFQRLREQGRSGERVDTGGRLEEQNEKEDMEEALLKLTACLEPAYLANLGEITDVIREFIFLGSHAVLSPNGATEDPGVQYPGVRALASILDPETMQRGLGKVEGADEDSLWTAIGEAARELKAHLPAVSRLNIVKDLCVISQYAGGTVSRKEQDVLCDLGQMLEVRSDFVDQILQSVARGLD
jgi:phage terminase Nu1 subunit (DNA packaging protein)